MNPLEARRRLLGRNVYKRATEGNSAVAQGSLARMYPGITMHGWTEQDSTTGAQLFDYVNAPYDDSLRGANCAISDDGGILFSGTYTGSTSGRLYVRYNISDLQPGTYCISGSIDNVSVQVRDNDNSQIFHDTFTITTTTNIWMYIVIDGTNTGDGGTLDNIVIYPMLNEGATALPWEPYTGGKPSPSPDYPQEIVSAGKYNEDTQKWEYEISVGGAQLFDISKVITKEGVVINNGDGTLTVKTIMDSNGVSAKSPHRLRDYCPDIVSGKTYYLYADSTGSEKFIYFNKSMSGWYFGSSKIITDDDLDSIVYFYASGILTEATVSNIMITEVSNAPYEQYKPPQTVTLTSDRPLTKWDKLEKRNGQWGWVYKSAEIESYTDESVPGEYYSTTGQLSVGAQVWYETATETFVPLSPEEQEQMNALHTFRPTTVLSNDEGCEMSLTYKTKKSLEVTT